MTAAADPSSPPPSAAANPPRRSPTFRLVSLLIIAALACLVLWYAGVFKGQPRVAIVTSGDGPYWDPVIAGAEEAAEQYDVHLTVMRCKSDKQVQFDAIRSVLAQATGGVAVSPLDPDFQSTVLADVASRTDARHVRLRQPRVAAAVLRRHRQLRRRPPLRRGDQGRPP